MIWESVYKKIKEIGAGGNGNVYEVAKIESNPDEHFALKCLKNNTLSSE